MFTSDKQFLSYFEHLIRAQCTKRANMGLFRLSNKKEDNPYQLPFSNKFHLKNEDEDIVINFVDPDSEFADYKINKNIIESFFSEFVMKNGFVGIFNSTNCEYCIRWDLLFCDSEKRLLCSHLNEIAINKNNK